MKNVIYLFMVLSLFSCSSEIPKESNPNIIMIMTDDLGWFDTGFNGNNKVKTPNLDKLAKQGIILDRFYAASAVCSPTRASFITGRNPLRMNIYTANTGHMLEEEITIPELLKQKNYATAHFGKWHLGTFTKDIRDSNRGGLAKNDIHYSIPTMHGYDKYFCTEAKVPTYDPMIFPTVFEEAESKRYGWKAISKNRSSEEYGSYYWENGPAKVEENLDGTNARIIMDRVIPFVEKEGIDESAFFATIWFHTPHLPVVADSAQRSVYQNLSIEEQIYYGTITAMDEQVGRLWKKLEQIGISDNTMLWFCSDNGPERDTPGSAGEFRERKRSLYEGGVRVPAFVVWKDKLAGDQRVNFPSVTSDYLPTLVDVLDLEYPKHRPLDGISLMPMLEKKVNTRSKPIGFIYPRYQKVSWLTDTYKLISTDSMKTFELYDLIKDKKEENNILNTEASLTSDMKEDLNQWLDSVKKSSIGGDY